MILSVVDNPVSVFFRLTNDPDFQHTLEIALPQFGRLRAALARVIGPHYVDLQKGRDGVTQTFVPVHSSLALLVFAAGPVVACICILLQVLPKASGDRERPANAYVNSTGFWCYGLFTSLALLVVTQLTTNLTVNFIHTVYPQGDYTHEYTQAGQYALLAEMVAAGCCLILVWLAYFRNQYAVPARTGARPATVRKVPLWKRLRAFIEHRSHWVAAAGIFLLVVTIPSVGSPVQYFALPKRPDGRPVWMITTEMDLIANMATNLILIFEQALGGEYLLPAALGQYLIQTLSCECLCLPFGQAWSAIKGVAGDIGDGIESIGSAFGFRRRLLTTPTTDTTLSLGSLLGVSCTPPSCEGTRVCPFDIIEDFEEKIVDLVTEGMEWVIDHVVDLLMQLLSGVDAIDHVLEALPQIDALNDFDFLDIDKFGGHIHFPVEIAGLNLGILPNLHTPSFHAPDLTTWILLGLFALGIVAVMWVAGLLDPMLQVAFLTAELSLAIGFLLLVIGTVVLGYGLKDELNNWQRDIAITWKDTAWMYVVSLLTLAIAALLKIGEVLGGKGAYEVVPSGEG